MTAQESAIYNQAIKESKVIAEHVSYGWAKIIAPIYPRPKAFFWQVWFDRSAKVKVIDKNTFVDKVPGDWYYAPSFEEIVNAIQGDELDFVAVRKCQSGFRCSLCMPDVIYNGEPQPKLADAAAALLLLIHQEKSK